jgi:hypothetical protein
MAWLVATGLVLSACTLGEAKASPSEQPEKPRPIPSIVSSDGPMVTPVPRVPATATPLPLPQHPIYILDPNDGQHISRILVIDPDQQRLVRRIPTR